MVYCSIMDVQLLLLFSRRYALILMGSTKQELDSVKETEEMRKLRYLYAK